MIKRCSLNPDQAGSRKIEVNGQRLPAQALGNQSSLHHRTFRLGLRSPAIIPLVAAGPFAVEESGGRH